MSVKIQVRRDTAANWSTNNPTLAEGEIGLDQTNNFFKVGDGSTAWNSLAQFTQNIENVEDLVGAMVTSNEETFINVTYDDNDGTLNFVVPVHDQDTMSSDSAQHLATQQSIKAYVDTTVGASDLDMAGDSGTGAIDLDEEVLTIAGTTNEIETSMSANTLTIGLPTNVTIAGNLTVSGTTTEISSTTINVADPLLSLATNNDSSDAVDIGLYGLYDTSGSQDLYGGLFRDASDTKWKLFKDNQAVPTTTVNTSGTGYVTATLVADIEGDLTGDSTGTHTGITAHLDNVESTFGSSGTSDMTIKFDGSNGVLYLDGGGDMWHGANKHHFWSENWTDFPNNAKQSLQLDPNAGVLLYYNNSKKFETTNTGAALTGVLTATSLTGDVTGDVTGTVSSIANHDTDSLSEGSSNLYYTQARADARVTALALTDPLITGTSGSLADPVMKITSDSENVAHPQIQLQNSVDDIVSISASRTELASRDKYSLRFSLDPNNTQAQAGVAAGQEYIEFSKEYTNLTGGTYDDGTDETKMNMHAYGGNKGFAIHVSGRNTSGTVANKPMYVHAENFTIWDQTNDEAGLIFASDYIAGRWIKDEDDMASDSATAIASQQSIKAYVDAQIGAENTLAEDNDVNITSAADGSMLLYDTGTSMWIDNVMSGDATLADTGAVTFATVNSNVGAFGSATAIPVVTVNAKGLVTAVATSSITTALTVGADTGSDDSVALATDTLNFEGGDGIDTIVSDNKINIAVSDTVVQTAATQILTNKTLTSPVINTGVSGTAILDSDTMSGASASTLATSESIKAYVDAHDQLNFSGDTGGALTIDLATESMTFTGGTGIDTIGSANNMGFAIDSTVVTLTGSQSLSNKTLASPTISGTITAASDLAISGTAASLTDPLLDLIIDTAGWNKPHLRMTDSGNNVMLWNSEFNSGQNAYKTIIQLDPDNDNSESFAHTAGGFTVGLRYKITAAGNTDFTAIGAADNNVDTYFVATGVGSGTGTALSEAYAGDYGYYFLKTYNDVAVPAVGVQMKQDIWGSGLGGAQLQVRGNGSNQYAYVPYEINSGGLRLKDNTSAGYIYFPEDESNGTHETTLIGASSQAASTVLTLPSATDTLVGKATTDTLTNKTLTDPVLNGTITGTGLDAYLSGGTGVTYSSGAISIGQAVATTSDVTFNDLIVSGDFTVSGDTTTVNTSTLAVEDPLVSLATGNDSSDAIDIGIYGLYDTSGSLDLYGGLFRDANDSGKWKLFKDNQAAPTTTVNTSGTGYAVGTLVANVEGDLTGDVTGDVTGNVTGNASGTALTVTQAAQTAITSLGTLTGLSMTGDLNMEDSDKIVMGTGDDLQIYHDGSNSFVKDGGTGALEIWTDELKVKNAAGDENQIHAAQDGAVTLYHDNVARVATSATGITVTGNLVPVADVTHDLGTSSLRWNDIYLSGSTIDLGGTLIQKDASGDIKFMSDATTYRRLLGQEIDVGTDTNRIRMRRRASNNRMKFYKFIGGVESATGVDLDENDTDDLTEGSTNEYFTQARARTSVSATGSLSYTSGTGVFDYTERTAAEILTAIKTVDGTGTGLDADLLDGIEATSFVRSDADDTIGGNIEMTKKLIAYRKNWASPEAWAVSSATAQTGYHGGNFTLNGDGNAIVHGTGPDGKRCLLWTSTNNDAGADADGGWDKLMTNLPSDDANYMSVVYVMKTTTAETGTFYHGCNDSSATLDLNGSANGNPYFGSTACSALPKDIWCVSIGFVNGNSNAATTNATYSGLYRLDTGLQVTDYTDFKMADGVTTQESRVYMNNSTDATGISWAQPAFYECNGLEPTIEELTFGTRDKINVYNVSGTLLNSSHY